MFPVVEDGTRTDEDEAVGLLRRTFADAAVAFQIFRADGHCLYTNAAFLRLFGAAPPPEYSVLEDEILRRHGHLPLVHRAFAGETVSVPPIWYDVREQTDAPGGRRAGVGATFLPLRDRQGRMAWVAVVFEDLTESLREREHSEAARIEAERSERRAQLLAGAGKLLASSLDPEHTLASVARLAVPELADFCIVDLIDRQSGEVRRVASAHIDPTMEPLLEELRRRYPPGPRSPAPAARAMASGEGHLIVDVDEEGWRSHTVDEHHYGLMRRLGVRSHIAVPLAARGRIVGAISFGYAASGRRYSAADLRTAEELAARAALAIDNARLYADADNARREAEHDRLRLHALVSQAPAYVFILRGPQHQLELMNPPFARLVGEAAEALGRPIGELLPLAVRAYLPIWDGVYRTGDPYEAREVAIPLSGAGGALEERYINFVLQPLRTPDGVVDGVMSFGFDVSGEVQARRRSEAALEQAEAASRAKDEFLAMLGHELRNPLAPIATALHLLQLRGGGENGRELEVIDRQVKHVIRLVDDLLDVSRITRGKIQLRRTRVEAAIVVKNAVEMASPLLEERRHRLMVQVPRTGLLLDADDARLAQVVANLLTNAAKYTAPGGAISVAAAREDNEVVLRVRDDGRGISAEMLPRIFELFVQGQRASDRAEGGLGLGLALVRSLVEMHGGRVSAHSEGPERGSEFVVRLPPAPAGEEGLAEEPLRTAAAGPGARRRVLLVDDNHDAAELLGELLRSAGHEVVVAHDGPAALAQLRSFHPEVAVLDIGLPVMDGYELARRLRAEPALTGLRCIAVTGYGQETDRARSEKAGFDLHLVKPVDVSALLQALAG